MAQAVTVAEFGPLALYLIEIWPEASLMMVEMRKNGETRSGPFSMQDSVPFLDRPDAADPGADIDAAAVVLQKTRDRSPESSTASWAGGQSELDEEVHLPDLFPVDEIDGSKSLTSPAIRVEIAARRRIG